MTEQEQFEAMLTRARIPFEINTYNNGRSFAVTVTMSQGMISPAGKVTDVWFKADGSLEAIAPCD